MNFRFNLALWVAVVFTPCR